MVKRDICVIMNPSQSGRRSAGFIPRDMFLIFYQARFQSGFHFQSCFKDRGREGCQCSIKRTQLQKEKTVYYTRRKTTGCRI